MPRLSVVVITYNEERNIGRCLRSIQDVADEIVVVDSLSTDKTEEIARSYGARFIQHTFEGYIEQKNWATSQATYDHILFLDADEALSEELKNSILEVKKNWKYDGYTFNRLTNYCGHWIHYTSWYPSRKLRLFDRRKGKWGGINPHDEFIINENTKIKHLKGDLLHFSYYSIDQQIKQINNFTNILAESYYKRCLLPNFYWHVLFHPLWRFFRDYFIKRGFLGGFYGFIISLNGAFEVYLKYLKLYHKIKSQKKLPPYKICFYSNSIFKNTQNSWMEDYILHLKEKGFSTVVVAPGNSFLIDFAQQSNIHFFKLNKRKNIIDFTNIFTTLRFIKFLKTYKIATLIIDNQSNERIPLFCARMARVKQIILHAKNANYKANVSNRQHLYFKQIIDTPVIKNEYNFQTLLINLYRIIHTDVNKNSCEIDFERIDEAIGCKVIPFDNEKGEML